MPDEPLKVHYEWRALKPEAWLVSYSIIPIGFDGRAAMCPVCAAMIPPNMTDHHDDWHRNVSCVAKIAIADVDD